MNTTWLPSTRVLVIVVLIALTVWVAVVALPLFEAIGIAALLAYLLDPVVRWLMLRTRLGRSWAAGITFLIFVLILVGIPAGLGTLAVTQFQRLETDILAAINEIGDFISQPIEIFNYRFDPQDMLGDLPAMTRDALALLPTGSLNILSAVTTNLLWGMAVLVTLYYFLKDGPKIKPWLVLLAPIPYRPEIRRLLNSVDRIWGQFLRMQLLIFLILMVLAAAGTLLVVWLFRSGLLEWSFWLFALLLLAVYTAVQQVDNLWLRPQFLGKQLRLHPGIVFIGLIGALALSGVLGALVIVPILATAKVVGQYVHLKLLGLSPWPEEMPQNGEADSENTDNQPETTQPGSVEDGI